MQKITGGASSGVPASIVDASSVNAFKNRLDIGTTSDASTVLVVHYLTCYKLQHSVTRPVSARDAFVRIVALLP